MKEEIKKGFGFAIGFILGSSLITSVSKSINDALKADKEKSHDETKEEKESD